MIVELIGHPGSGKSTLHLLLEERLTAAGVDVRLVHATALMEKGAVFRKLAQLYGYIRRPRLAMLGLRFLKTSKMFGWRTIGQVGGTAYRSYRIGRHAQDSALFLVDEGIFHSVWSLTLFAPSTLDIPTLRAFISAATDAEGVVSLRPDAAVTIQRMQDKPGYHLASRSTAELGAILEKQSRMLDFCEDLVAQDGFVVQLDGSEGEADGAVDRLAEAWRRANT